MPTKPLDSHYRILWWAEAVSTLSTQASALAFPLLILAAIGSPAQAGLMGAVRGLPYLLFGLLAGGLVDRWDCRRVMVLCDAGRALALGSITLALALGRLTAAHLYVVSFVEGTLFIFFGLAGTSALRGVVPPAQLPAAVAQGQATLAAAGLAGPALGGVLFGLGRALLGLRARLHGDRDAARRPLYMRQEIPLTNLERATVDGDVAVTEQLIAQLRDVPTPSGPTPQQLAEHEP